MRFEKDMDGAMEPSSDGQWVRWDNYREKLARYDEAVSLIEEFLRDGLEPQLARRAEAFLDTEPKEGRG
jgi:hypothetical protein